MDALNIDLNFEGINAAGGLGTLPAGLHVGRIAEFRHFPDTNRLYVYMLTGGIRHRESFGLENPNSMPYGMLTSSTHQHRLTLMAVALRVAMPDTCSTKRSSGIRCSLIVMHRIQT